MKAYSFCMGLFFAVCAMNVHAQDIVRDLQRNVPGQGTVKIYQDPAVASLMDTNSLNNTGELKTQGYRIQVYAGGNSRTAKNEAERVAARVKTHFPDLAVYTTFIPPRWLCRAGNFRTMEEADAKMRQLKNTGVFKEVVIVKDQIVISF